MEHSLSSLTFKGSISQAITEAKTQRKLFVVYISGENAESSQLQQSAWTNFNVAESVSKYCILLHISEGSADAAHFSAIYPQKSVPCITAIGYNGVKLWQNEGFVNAEVLVSSLEKAWLSLHIQQTTTTVLSAALSSKKSETSSGDSNVALGDQESSSGTLAPPPSIETSLQSPESGKEVASEIKEEGNDFECAVANNVTSPNLSDASKSDVFGDKQSVSFNQAAQGVPDPITTAMGDAGAVNTSSEAMSSDNQFGVAKGSSKSIDPEANACMQNEIYETVDNKGDATDNNVGVSKSSDALLNIRLPDGASLQEKFPITSTLRMVKQYVDENGACGIHSYDLAIPYPRKVFNDQDLSRTLLELGLSDRQALILVPHHKPDGNRGISLSAKENYRTDDSSVQADEGYFGRVKRILSYFNPFSYLGGGASTSSSAQEFQEGMWEYRPNPALQNNLRGAARPQPDQNYHTDSRDSTRNRQPLSSRFGSNIHTLRHDEDDSRFSGRNAFWNGNSTQYGGDNDGK